MNVALLCFSHNKMMNQLAQDMSYTAHTHVIDVEDFDYHQAIDLLFIGVDNNPKNNKKLTEFLNNIKRDNVHNIALFSTYTIKDWQLQKTKSLCIDKQLPLLREQFSIKCTIKTHHLDDESIIKARSYVEDMINIVNNYY